MTPRQFDRVMVAMHIGSHPKFARLNNNELLCFITGVLPVASQSLFRGTLTVGDQPATPEDISAQTGRRSSSAVVRSTIKKLSDVGVLFRDDEIGALRVHDFDDWNPAPKVDRTNAERQRRFRERHATSNGVTGGVSNAVTNGTVTLSEVEARNNSTPLPPQAGESTPPRRPSGNRKKDIDTWQRSLAAWTGEHFPGVAPGLVDSCAQTLRASRAEPTVEALAPLVAKWTESAA